MSFATFWRWLVPALTILAGALLPQLMPPQTYDGVIWVSGALVGLGVAHLLLIPRLMYLERANRLLAQRDSAKLP
jgi:hypothetical protein